MGLQTYLDVANATDPDALKRLLLKFANDRDFGLMSATLTRARTQGDGPAGYDFISNTPPAFLEAAHSADEGLRDPVSARFRSSPLPFAYDQQFYVASGASELWEHQAAFGYRCGLAVALHMPADQYFLFGVDTDRSLPKGDNLQTALADLTLMAAYAKEAMLRFFPSVGSVPPVSITAREREVLLWLMDGLTSGDISRKLSISTLTVHYHVASIMRKLGVSTRHQAVAKAIRLGVL